MNFSIIPAPNGLGHIMRMIELCEILSNKGSRVELIIPSYADKFIKGLKTSNNYEISSISWNKRKLETSEDAIKFSKMACSHIKNNFVVSDNLTETFLFSKNILLSANFLWNDQRDYLVNNEKDIYQTLIEQKIPIVTNKFFLSNRLSKYNNLIKIGFYEKNIKPTISSSQNSLLISLGISEREKKNELIELIRKINNSDLSFFDNIFVEPKIYPYVEDCQNIRLATYDKKMYSKISDAVVRPGLSSIQQLLSVGARIFPLNIGANEEIIHNSRVIENLGMGKEIKLSNMISTIKSSRSMSYAKKNFFSGEMEVINVFNNQENFTSI